MVFQRVSRDPWVEGESRQDKGDHTHIAHEETSSEEEREKKNEESPSGRATLDGDP